MALIVPLCLCAPCCLTLPSVPPSLLCLCFPSLCLFSLTLPPFPALLQINDRYEFPEELDLDFKDRCIFASEADKNVRNQYRLHRCELCGDEMRGGTAGDPRAGTAGDICGEGGGQCTYGVAQQLWLGKQACFR